MATLYFLDQFRKSYVGEQTQLTSRVYTKLAEAFGLNDLNMILGVIVQKMYVMRFVSLTYVKHLVSPIFGFGRHRKTSLQKHFDC
jgi:hypothetical protein